MFLCRRAKRCHLRWRPRRDGYRQGHRHLLHVWTSPGADLRPGERHKHTHSHMTLLLQEVGGRFKLVSDFTWSHFFDRISSRTCWSWWTITSGAHWRMLKCELVYKLLENVDTKPDSTHLYYFNHANAQTTDTFTIILTFYRVPEDRCVEDIVHWFKETENMRNNQISSNLVILHFASAFHIITLL